MPIPKISDATLRRNANIRSFERGEGYYRAGAVTALTQRGNLIQADVEGTEVQPYQVTLHFDQGGITSVYCTCAYSNEGWCKHIVATLLVCSRQPETIQERPPLERLLDQLDHVQTQRLVQQLVAEQPKLIDAIDRHISLITVPTPQKQSVKPARRTTLDPSPFRRQVQQILRDVLHGYEEGWEEDPLTDNLLEVIQTAQGFSERGDGNNALVILEAITDACVKDWDDVADYGADNEETATALDEAWTEAILSAELTPEEKVDWRVSLEAWQDEWNVDFSMSLEALRQGWDFLSLERVLQGNVTQRGVWGAEPPHFADDLALIRLQILDRQERYQEYLYLAQAEGQTQQYLTMLGRLGRVEEAMGAAKTQLSSMEEAFALAQTLRQQEALPQALEIAQAGLTLPGNCQYDLATWTSDLAEGLGDRSAGLDARVIAFKAHPSFEDYRKIEELAGDNWSAVKTDLLAYLLTYQGWGTYEAKVDVFLHEGRIDDAITTVTGLSSYESALIHRVMDAAINHHPDWVIENARRRAEPIMDEGKADRYDQAVNWLKKARAAYLASGRSTEWSSYRAQLMQTHARKRKLMEMFKQRDMG